MKHIEINLGKACNNRCRFCMSGESANLVDPLKIEKEIIDSGKNGYTSLGFLGGEATLHPGLLDFVSLANENGFEKIHLISNGRKFEDVAFLNKLIDAGVNRFSISIHSHDEAVEDYLTQVGGGFKQKIKGLKNLIQLKKKGLINHNLSINYVINKRNYQSIIKSLQYFNALGVKDFRLNFMWPEGNASNYYPKILIAYKDFAPYISKIIFLSKRLGFHVVFEGIPACIFPDPKNNKEYIGELLDENTDVIFHEKDFKHSFNWQERKKNELKGKALSCQSCELNSDCEGVWLKYVEHYGWNEFKPFKE